MKTAKLFAVLVITALLLSLAAPVAAAPPADNPGRGAPDPHLIAFVHYPKGAEGNASSAAFPVTTEPGGSETDGWIYAGLHWSDDVVLSATGVAYWVNVEGSGDDGHFVEAIAASSQTWEDDTGSYMDFTLAGTADVECSSLRNKMDGLNTVTWENLRRFPGAIAVSFTWYDRNTLEILEADIALNNWRDFVWSSNWDAITDPDNQTGDPDFYDVQNIVTHEFGHFLCLEDLYEDINADKTMYGYSDYGEINKRTLEDSDRTGIGYIYPGAAIVEPVAVSIGPNQTGSGSAGDVVSYTFTVSNEGTGDDVFDITTSSTEGWTVSLYKADGVTALPDSDGDEVPDTGSLALGEPANIVVKVAIADTATAGTKDITTATATSSVDIGISDSATATTTVVGEAVVHVSIMKMWYTTAGPNKFIYTKVTIVDGDNVAVPEATVYLDMTLPDGSSVSASGQTNGNGTVTFKLKSRQTGTYTSNVTNVAKDGWTYDKMRSLELEDDSDADGNPDEQLAVP